MSEVLSGNDRAILEPEIEQIAIDQEMIVGLGDRREKPVKRGGRGGWNLAEVRIGHHDDAFRWGRHAPS
jgi:hypothetical protein